MADIVTKTDGTVWLCGDITRVQLPTVSAGGSSQANMINAAVQRGAVDRRIGQPNAWTQTKMTHTLEGLHPL